MYASGKVPSAKSLLHPGKIQTQLEHAAFMAAASHLSRRYPNAELDEEQLKKTAARYDKDPVFQSVMKDKAQTWIRSETESRRSARDIFYLRDVMQKRC